MSDVQSLPSPVDAIAAYVDDRWPELEDIPGVWITGGQVWRRMLGQPLEDAKDLDICCVTKTAHKKVMALLDKLAHGGDDAPASMGPLGGLAFWTTRGRVDVWEDTGIAATLRRYSDAKAAVRVAYSPSKRRLMWLPSHVVRAPGEKYIHYDPGCEFKSATLDWREWPGE
jgi:hypothetical protein